MKGFAWVANALESVFRDGGGVDDTPKPEQAIARASQEPEDPRTAKVRRAHLGLLRGVEAFQANDPVTGVERLQEAFIEFRLIGETTKASLVQKVVGLMFHHIEDIAEARKAYQRARTLLEQAGMPDEAARVLTLAGDLEVSRREYKEGYRAFKEAISLCRAEGLAELEIQALTHYAEAEEGRGRVSEAQMLMEQAEEVRNRDAEGG